MTRAATDRPAGRPTGVRDSSRPSRGALDYLARWPSRQATQHARDRIRFMTMRARLAAPVEQVVQELNIFLRGWAGYCVSRGHARWDRRAVGSMI